MNNNISKIEDEELRNFFELRYLRVVKKLEESTKRSAFWYNIFTFVVTVGSILVPALISVQDRGISPSNNEEEKNEHSNNIYWSVWGISLSVTVSNALIKMLSLDKTYITRNVKLNQFKSEGSLFLSKAGVYDLEDIKERFKLFVINIENLKRDQVLEEYTYKQEGNKIDPS